MAGSFKLMADIRQHTSGIPPREETPHIFPIAKEPSRLGPDNWHHYDQTTAISKLPAENASEAFAGV